MKKCPYCAEEIQDEAIICRYCGRDLVAIPPKVVTQAISQSTPAITKVKKPKWLLLVILAVVILVVIANINKPTNAPSSVVNVETIVAQTMQASAAQTQVAATFLPTATPIYWDSSKTYAAADPNLYKEILKNKGTMTDIQFKEYLGQQVGKRIYVKATVREVLTDNRVYLSAVDGGFFDTVYLSGLPKDILMKLNKDQVVEFDATISEFNEFLITVMNLTDPAIYSIR